MKSLLKTLQAFAPRHYLWAFIIFFAVMTLTRLGNTESPQTTWVAGEGGAHAHIDLGHTQHISRIQFFAGARHGGEAPFTVFFSDDGHTWDTIPSVEFNDFSVFFWAERQLDVSARFMQFAQHAPGLRLHEVALRDAHDNIITPMFLLNPEAELLFDEQELVPDRRTFMNSSYFDEIYHARTGYEFLHGLRVLETTHPPMGKNFIALSVAILGMTPFAWRLPGALTGIFMLPLIYLFAKAIFESLLTQSKPLDKHRLDTPKWWALFATFIYGFDFMVFTQTRIATIDSYLVLFVIATYYCMFMYVRDCEKISLKKALFWLCLCGIALAFAMSSKWQGAYAAAGLPFVFFPALYRVFKKDRREAYITLAACFGFFIAIPVTIYTLSYIPFVNEHMMSGFWLDGRQIMEPSWLATVINNQHWMFSYHAFLVAEHPFTSRWWEWPLLIRPIFYYQNIIDSYVRHGISSFGNPAIWWGGIAATIVAIGLLWRKNPALNRAIIFLLIAYAAQLLPWVPVTRLTFIYHYFPSVPFVVLLIAICFYVLAKSKAIIFGYAALVMALFIMFYPVLSGAAAENWYLDILRWLPGWVLA